MTTEAEAITAKMPSDNEVVVGKVTSGNPLTVNLRGASVPAGRLKNEGVTIGDNVAMVRQDASWLVLGKVIAGTGLGGLGITQIVTAEATGTLALTAADQIVPGMTVTIATTSPNAQFLCFWTTEFITLAANTSTSNSQLYLDGVAKNNQAATQRADTTQQRGTYGTFNLFAAGAPGNHTIDCRGRTSGGAGIAQINNSNTNLIVVVLE